jgi:hypothetical protein
VAAHSCRRLSLVVEACTWIPCCTARRRDDTLVALLTITDAARRARSTPTAHHRRPLRQHPRPPPTDGCEELAVDDIGRPVRVPYPSAPTADTHHHSSMESPGAYPESPSEQDDVVYPCKGCGEVELLLGSRLPVLTPARFSKKERPLSSVCTFPRRGPPLSRLPCECETDKRQRGTDGISIASAATRAARYSTRMRTCCCWATAR